MHFILSFFWFTRTAKAILFWFYLWQLKEYHIGRFLDHFKTKNGKSLFFNKVFLFKILSAVIFLIFTLWNPKTSHPASFGDILFILYSSLFLYSILAIYIFESAVGFWHFLQKKLKRPVLTKKTVLLILLGIIAECLLFLVIVLNIGNLYENKYSLTFWLLFLDILIPLIVSVIVLLFQPFAVLGRNRILSKAKKKRGNLKDLIVIGITGSYGKTSTKEFLATILSEKYKVLKTKKHQNSEVGISQCILNDLKPEHEIFVCEMGAYNKGGINMLCSIIKPKIGVLTGINEQHMATFGSQDNIIKAKFELIDCLSEDGTAFLNWDNEFIVQNHKRNFRAIKYSTFKKEDIWAENIKVERDSLSFRVLSKDGSSADFEVNLIGEHNLPNILGAAAVAKELGMSLEEISRACQRFETWQGGMKIREGTFNIIDATYSANPNGVISHLDYLKLWPGKKVIVMPCLIELGKSSKEVHRRMGRKIGEVCDLAIITTEDRFEELREGVIESGGKEENILSLDNPQEIFDKIKEFSDSDTVVLLESRVPSQLINYLEIVY